MSCPWAFLWIVPLFLLGILIVLGFGILLSLILMGNPEQSGIDLE